MDHAIAAVVLVFVLGLVCVQLCYVGCWCVEDVTLVDSSNNNTEGSRIQSVGVSYS